MKKTSKEEFAQTMKKEREQSERMCELLNEVAETLAEEFNICHWDAEYEMAKRGRDWLDENY